MRRPLITEDFLVRAETVYGSIVGVVDEPDGPDALGAMTYATVARRVRALAAGLDALGVGVGARVAVVAPNSARLLELFYAVPTFGRVLVPINFRLKPREIEYIVGHSGAELLLVDPSLVTDLADIPVKHRRVLGADSDAALLRFDREPAPWTDADEDATATINYTSGTTARPKGVQITHRNIWIDAVTFGLHATVSDRDTYLHTLPMFHANGWGMLYTALGVGAPQVVLRKVDGAEILRRIDRHGVTLMCAAPAVVHAVLDAARTWTAPVPGRDRKARVIVAGAPPPTTTIARIESELGWEFVQIYGLTETAPLLTINRRRPEDDALPIADAARKLARAGAPALGVRLAIDATGEVLARGNVVLAGYWQEPEATAIALADDWFHTGDGGSIDDDGYLSISDRKKDVIITGGENVSSIEVEDCIHEIPGIVECAVIGIPDDRWGETVKAVVVLAHDSDLTGADIIAHCKRRLAGYKAPTSVDVVDALPRTATGKVQKFRLRAPYWAGRDRGVS